MAMTERRKRLMLGDTIGPDSSAADEDKNGSDSVNCNSIMQAFKPRNIDLHDLRFILRAGICIYLSRS